MNNHTTATCTPAMFYLDIPLYEEIAVLENEDQQATNIVMYTGPLDAYCEGCNSHSIFRRFLQGRPAEDAWSQQFRRDLTLGCSRNGGHQLHFILQVSEDKKTIQKIGQFPSLATLSMYDVRKYSAVLEKATFKELTKAIGLAAHGVGIGSFVYLRRIFEGLVEQAHIAAKAGAGWDEVQYGSSRMGEKIALLAAFLPAFLVENKTMYGILSKGIHELTEAECLAAFPVVKVGIEIILDAKIEEAAARKKLETARLAIQKLASGVANANGV